MAALVPAQQVVDAIAAKFGVSERTAWTDVKQVRRAWVRTDARAHAHQPALLVRRCLLLSQVAEKNKDLPTALRAMELLARMTGLLQPPAVNVATSVQVDQRQMTADDCRRSDPREVPGSSWPALRAVTRDVAHLRRPASRPDRV
jgi:hypothetical protein